MADSREDFVLGHIERALTWAAGHLRDDLFMHVTGTVCESPLEEAFWAAWDVRRILSNWGTSYFDTYDLKLSPQQEVTANDRRYRLDFQLTFHPRLENEFHDIARQCFPLIAIELDGHEFHERTKAQVAERNQRDRDLMSVGWKVFHFSGSEFHRDPQGCVEAIWEYVDRNVLDIVRAHRLGQYDDATHSNHQAELLPQ